jgi:hypothetical protein
LTQGGLTMKRSKFNEEQIIGILVADRQQKQTP